MYDSKNEKLLSSHCLYILVFLLPVQDKKPTYNIMSVCSLLNDIYPLDDHVISVYDTLSINGELGV